MEQKKSKRKSKKVGVPVRKASPSGSARVPSAKKPTASRRSDPSRADAQKAKRHVLYKKMLKVIGSPKFCLCNGLCCALDKISPERHIESLPELLKQKPREADSYWWPGHNKAPRIKALKAAIKASAPALRIGAKPKAARPRAGAKRSGAKPGPKATPNKKK